MEANPHPNPIWSDIRKFASDSNLLLFLNEQLYRFLNEIPDEPAKITVADADEVYERICIIRGLTQDYAKNWHAISECSLAKSLGQDWANKAREFYELIQNIRVIMDRIYEMIVRMKQNVLAAEEDDDDDDLDGISDEEYSEEGGIGMSSDEEEECERLRPPGH